MRISVENTPSHVQTRAVERFAEKLQERLEGRLTIEFYSGAALFRDQDVFGGMARGRVEMAVPGTWQIDRRIPEAGLFLLPEFYGLGPWLNYQVMASPLGDLINNRIEDGLGVKVLGDWIDLGPAQLFSCGDSFESYDDIANRRIRVAGGVGNQLRISLLGGEPMVIAFPDLPFFLNQGKADGVLTTYESVQSASLWDYGINSVFEDNQYFGQYVPMIAEEFWSRLPEDIRIILIETWQEGVGTARAEAAEAQIRAKELFIRSGGQVFVPSHDYLAQKRAELVEGSPQIARDIGISEEVYSMLEKFVGTEGDNP